jgi:hypothetical protein
MSNWDWMHAALEIATFEQARRAQEDLASMRSAYEADAARRVLIEAMRNFIYDIYRDIQSAEEQNSLFPHQVYIVARYLERRVEISGISPEIFPEFNDKEYVNKVTQKIADVIKRSRSVLTNNQIEDAEKAVQYIFEAQTLKQAILSKEAQESLLVIDSDWRRLSMRQNSKGCLVFLGLSGLAFCLFNWLIFSGEIVVTVSNIFSSNQSFLGILVWFLFAAFYCGVMIISIGSFILGIRPNPEYEPLKNKRDMLLKQQMSKSEWSQVVSQFGDLTIEKFRENYHERISFLISLLGEDIEQEFS